MYHMIDNNIFVSALRVCFVNLDRVKLICKTIHRNLSQSSPLHTFLLIFPISLMLICSIGRVHLTERTA